MLLNPKIYRSFEQLPIWNFDKLQSENDFRYLLQLNDYGKLPKINKYIEVDLLKTYHQLIKTHDTKRNTLLEAKKQVITLLVDLVLLVAKTSKEIDKIKKASTVLRALMIAPDNEQFLWNVDFTETPEQRQLLTQISVAIKKYNDKVRRVNSGKKQTLYEQVALIESELGVTIDVMKTPVRMYQAYVERLNDKARVNMKNVN